MTFDTASSAQYAGLLKTLKAYHSLLCQSVDPPVTETADPLGIVWLKTKPSHRISRKVLNGLELFALLARIDWNVWKQQAKVIWEGYTLHDFGDKPVRVGVDLDPKVEGRVEPIFEVFATSAQDHAQSADVVKARKVAKRILQDRGETMTEIPVRVTRERHENLNSFVYKVMQIVITQRFLDELDTNANRYHGLRLRFFRPKLASIALSTSELQQLAAIAAAGVAVDDFGTIKPEAHSQHPAIFTKSLLTLFAIGATDAFAFERGVKHVGFWKAFRAGMIPSIYSAVCASSSVRKISIDTAIDTKTAKKYHQQVWHWIGLTLFCQAPNNTHKLQALSMNVGKLEVADVEAMRDVISADDPIAKLYPRAALLATEAISSSRFFLDGPTQHNAVGRVTVESPGVLTDLPVLKKSMEWTTVLLPAWGQAWIHRDDIVAKQRWAKGPFPVKKIARIEFYDLRNESKDAVMALLRLVGGGVKHLVLKAHYTLISPCLDDWLTEALDVCPNLELLELDHVPINSLQFLLDAYESGKCRLTGFMTARVNIPSVDESLRRLFVALGDRSHPAARYLSEFGCSPVKLAMISDPIMLATAVGMLKMNQRLRNLELGYSWSDANPSELNGRTQPFRAFDKTKISRALTPLDVRQRIAFLSVVTPFQVQKRQSKHTQRSRAVEKLDACMLSLIFELAAECCERRVYLGVDCMSPPNSMRFG